MIVLDTSAVLDILVGRPEKSELISRVSEAVDLHAPHLIDVEVLHALRRLVRNDVVTDDRASEARKDFAALTIIRYPLGAMADHVWALRQNLTAYDATFVVLAEELALPLVTCDQRLARAAGHGATVEVY